MITREGFGGTQVLIKHLKATIHVCGIPDSDLGGAEWDWDRERKCVVAWVTPRTAELLTGRMRDLIAYVEPEAKPPAAIVKKKAVRQ